MSLSINGTSPAGYSSPPPTTPSNDGASFQQLLDQLANNFGMSPQELFNLITSQMNPSTGGGVPPSAPGVSAPATSGSAGSGNSDELNEVLTQFASNTLNAGQGMMKEAMEKFFQEEEPDEDDPDAEPL
ncbi:hypothetical protein J2W49_001923 [Hydrogenophaga palleronii]|uniref:Uncharacterized protein n=1 Tax=Hydrogenophaga palleronii TaxID=65655 RepID=A0ABU1WL06_9BURK|nr:hypothetical protein [Hydrogenophaga palleronii]MDR7149968.1 hypothetical protein [Hydrogenophaga palleronii]